MSKIKNIINVYSYFDKNSIKKYFPNINNDCYVIYLYDILENEFIEYNIDILVVDKSKLEDFILNEELPLIKIPKEKMEKLIQEIQKRRQEK